MFYNHGFLIIGYDDSGLCDDFDSVFLNSLWALATFPAAATEGFADISGYRPLGGGGKVITGGYGGDGWTFNTDWFDDFLNGIVAADLDDTRGGGGGGSFFVWDVVVSVWGVNDNVLVDGLGATGGGIFFVWDATFCWFI